MARASDVQIEVLDAVALLIRQISEDQSGNGDKLLKAAQKDAELTGNERTIKFWAGIGKGVQKYRETKLNQGDLDRIKAHNAKITQIQAEIQKIGAEIVKKYQSQADEAQKALDFVKDQQIAQQKAQELQKKTKKERENIEIEEKCVVAIKDKQKIAAEGAFCTETGWSRSETKETSKGNQYSFAGERFYVKATRRDPFDQEPLSWAGDWLIDVETRRIFVKPIGNGYNNEMLRGKAYFAGMWVDNGKINTRSVLCRLNYTWITIASEIKPKNPQELFEVTKRMNQRLELDNLSEKYTGGAEYAYRLVEEYDSSQEDKGHQRLLAETLDPGWNKLDEHVRIMNAWVEADMAKTRQNTTADAQKAA